MIFDVCERDDASPKKNQESDFEFLNRSARPEMSRVRDFIESITGSYSLAESKEIIARIKSGDDAHFKSAIFELVLHEALVRLGCTLTPHPELENGSKSKPVSTGGGIVDDWTPIRNAVKYKGSKYGELNKPLLVAVNLDSFHLDRIDEMQALFGQEQFVFSVGQSEEGFRFERAPNGAWYGKSGPQYTRVSGLWIFNDLSAYSIGVRRSTIYFNPWAAFSLPEILKYFPYASVEGEKMEWVEGARLSTLFGLKDGWPE